MHAEGAGGARVNRDVIFYDEKTSAMLEDLTRGELSACGGMFSFGWGWFSLGKGGFFGG